MPDDVRLYHIVVSHEEVVLPGDSTDKFIVEVLGVEDQLVRFSFRLQVMIKHHFCPCSDLRVVFLSLSRGLVWDDEICVRPLLALIKKRVRD